MSYTVPQYIVGVNKKMVAVTSPGVASFVKKSENGMIGKEEWNGQGTTECLDWEAVHNVTYEKIKWMILIIPTVTIGLWEYVRHEFLLPYLSMDAGNLLSPVIIFLVTITLLRKLFTIMEGIQEELHRERASKAALEEREKLAAQLHDGIAQSLFLMSVRLEQLEQDLQPDKKDSYYQLQKTLHHVNKDVRQAIANLRFPPTSEVFPWTQSIQQLIKEFEQTTGIVPTVEWLVPETALQTQEKIELYAFLRETLMNIRKHAQAQAVWIRLRERGETGWYCEVIDDGIGFGQQDPLALLDRFGLKILQERAKKMGWRFLLERDGQHTRAMVIKEE